MTDCLAAVPGWLVLKTWDRRCGRCSEGDMAYFIWQEREDSNPRPPVLETGALARLSYAPVTDCIDYVYPNMVPLEGLEPPTRDLGRRRSILAELQGRTGGDRGARTPNLGDANAALSQLSYIPRSYTTSLRRIVYQFTVSVKSPIKSCLVATIRFELMT